MPTDVDPPAVDLSFLLNQTSYALAARMAESLADLDLTVAQYCVLWKAGEEERTQIEIAELSGLDKTTVVNTLDELEGKGLATRRVHATDRRARVAAVTDPGADVLGHAHERIRQVYDDVLGDLPADERAAFLTTLSTLANGVLSAPSHVSAMRRRRSPRRAAP